MNAESFPCIYCGLSADRDEHWLSRGFGAIKGMALLRERICVRCNNALGELDEEILRTGPTAYFRNLLGIKGRRRHSEVDLFTYRAVSGPQPTTLTMKAPHGKYEILAESYRDEQGRHCARPLRQIVVERKDDAIECVPFRKDWTAETLRITLQNRNLQDSKLLEIYLTGDETAESIEYRTVLGQVFDVNSGATVWYGTSQSSTRDTTTLIAGIKRNYVTRIMGRKKKGS